MRITATMSDISANMAAKALEAQATQYRQIIEVMPEAKAVEIAAVEVEVDLLTEAVRALRAGVDSATKSRIRKACGCEST